jgi:hypothetical protein
MISVEIAKDIKKYYGLDAFDGLINKYQESWNEQWDLAIFELLRKHGFRPKKTKAYFKYLNRKLKQKGLHLYIIPRYDMTRDYHIGTYTLLLVTKKEYEILQNIKPQGNVFKLNGGIKNEG